MNRSNVCVARSNGRVNGLNGRVNGLNGGVARSNGGANRLNGQYKLIQLPSKQMNPSLKNREQHSKHIQKPFKQSIDLSKLMKSIFKAIKSTSKKTIQPNQNIYL